MCFFFKQKTADEMRISDWSSDVCSSDLEVDTLLDQILRLDIRICCTEAIGLGIGRYMLTREVQPADDVSMRLSGGGFCYLWNELGLTPLNDGETVGELQLDSVEAAPNQRQPAFFVPRRKRTARPPSGVSASGRVSSAAETQRV